MNRRQRRGLEKQTGLTKFKKGQNLQDRMARLSESQRSGKKKEEAMVDTRRRQTQKTNDDLASAEISSLATTLVIQEGLSYFKAMERAREIHREKAAS